MSQFRALPASDQMLALAYERYEADVCAGCGLPMHETFDSENERAYRAPAPIRCFACTAREKVADGYEDAKQRSALRFPVYRKEGVAAPIGVLGATVAGH